MKLIRGPQAGAFLPREAQSQVNSALQEKAWTWTCPAHPEDLEELVTNLDDLTVNVEGKQKVRIYSE